MASEMLIDQIVARIHDGFATGGHLDYGENISMREHMLQAAYLAAQNGEDNNVIVAALLHDFGHLICNMPNDTFEEGLDNDHEALGAMALEPWFGAAIAAPVRLHVDAKRYLCAAEPDYKYRLSDASITTLAIQGGQMTPGEMHAFRKKKGHRTAIRIRRYDDLGKNPQLRCPGLDHYTTMLAECLSRARSPI